MTDKERLAKIIDDAGYLCQYPGTLARILVENGVTFSDETKGIHKWIPVEDLPPNVECYSYSEDVLFRLKDGSQRVGYVDLDTGTWKVSGADRTYSAGKVTHWMKLPEEPEELRE